ncbi:GIY-YIG nuclease family protein [Clostridium tagluense]|uniref:Bacteriophage T5 Orf172 DNA-binding domain-containing protein n=1 Tax=Clostridium tagluense TaxID=360422 RepID=A0A401ULN5_9CLOT|nr:GIY-YIG nuclease family protein [Clostridium tagluense]GCD10443.1 hypothetical protein Ctaglu_20660 [Clostridium tagluense]
MVEDNNIYFILNRDTDSVKIGITKREVQKRLNALQTGCPNKLELIYAVKGNYTTEKYLHKLFDFDRIRLKGEWFNYSYHIKQWINNDKFLRINQ